MVKVGYWINDPSKLAVSTNIRKNFAETLKCEKKNFFILCAYFCEKILSWYQMHFSWIWRKRKKTFCGKRHSVFEGCKRASLNTLKLFFLQNVFFLFFSLIFIKNAFFTFSRSFSQKYARNKKVRVFGRKVFKLQLLNILIF